MTAARCTYRLQLHAGFPFAAAAAIVPYLAELGVSHLYLSPVLQAARGSTHGYDVVDPDRVSSELGGADGFAALAATARAAGLGILLDIVPNHMSIANAGSADGNAWWRDVLENGQASYYAHFFDVDWVGDDRVLLPVLGERYGRALAQGQLGVVHDGGGVLEVRAGDQRFPISPRSLGPILRRAGDRIGDAELAFIGDAYAYLPRPTGPDDEARRRRHRDKRVLAQRVRELCARDPACARAIDAEVAAVSADPAELDAVLEAQNYRLAHWSVAGSQLSYRRFFDINTLVGVRAEDADVFAAGHAKILTWLADGTIDGVRVDHVDGLRDPAGYLARLRAAPVPGERGPRPWIVVEKILAADETLAASWGIDGTTGYDAAARLTGLFVDPAGEAALTELYEQAAGAPWDPAAARRSARLEVMADVLHSELARLADMAVRACAQSAACRDYTRAEIEGALAEIIAGYSSYRTYFGDDSGASASMDAGAAATELREHEHADDRARIAAAAEAALRAQPSLDRDLVAFLVAALSHELPSVDARALAHAAQQVTGAVVAKGDEDTFAYRAVRLVARCEVGVDVARFADAPGEVHAAFARAPGSGLVATSTHDTKRSEDVRARIAVLSEIPERWAAAVARWQARADRYWTVAPDRVLELALWQTLVGAWPLPHERALAFAYKATREARLRTSWRRQDAAYEHAMAAWLDGVYRDRELVGELEAFAAEIAPHGDRNSLAQLAIKLCAPGVPDLYQGCEWRDDSLVDPDNRRAVDFAARERGLRALRALSAVDVAQRDLSQRKQWLIGRALAVRARAPAAFEAPYRPLATLGVDAERVFAFTRGDALAVIVPRLGVRADHRRATTLALPAGHWRDVVNDRDHAGGTVDASALLGAFGVAILLRRP